MRDELKFKSTPKRSWDIRTDDPLVSVCVQTFQHVPYIKDCLDGILMQETDFPFELLLQDDASTDGTAEICREYADRYPNIIRPFLFSENQYSRGFRPFADLQRSRIRGKYSATCEGDDYWTDPQKLQKQVDFMEAHSDCSLCHSDADFHYTKDGAILKNITRRRFPYLNRVENVHEAILRSEYPIHTCSAVYQQSLLDQLDISEMSNYVMGDTFIWLEACHSGKVHFFDESMVTRNILVESAAHSKDPSKILSFKKSGYELCQHFSEKYPTSDATKTIMHEKFNKTILKWAYMAKDRDEAKKAFRALRENASGKVGMKDVVMKWGSMNVCIRFFAESAFLVNRVRKRLFG